MGKRSDFKRRKNDAYYTPNKPIDMLLPFLIDVKTFIEPCVGHYAIVNRLEQFDIKCVFSGDIEQGFDAITDERLDMVEADAIITNPPWTRELLHPMIERFSRHSPTWLLFDADWMHTKQSRPYIKMCTDIVSVGRVKWIEDSKNTGKDNSAWYRFDANHFSYPKFHGI